MENEVRVRRMLKHLRGTLKSHQEYVRWRINVRWGQPESRIFTQDDSHSDGSGPEGTIQSSSHTYKNFQHSVSQQRQVDTQRPGPDAAKSHWITEQGREGSSYGRSNLEQAGSRGACRYLCRIRRCSGSTSWFGDSFSRRMGTRMSERHDFSGRHHAGLEHSQPAHAVIRFRALGCKTGTL